MQEKDILTMDEKHDYFYPIYQNDKKYPTLYKKKRKKKKSIYFFMSKWYANH
jgi:hypothetical protein